MSEEKTKHVWVYSFDKAMQERKQSDVSLTALFLPSLSRDVDAYRKEVFDMLKQDTDCGEQRWVAIMERLWRLESEGFSDDLKNTRRTLYPQTIAEGERYFLGLKHSGPVAVDLHQGYGVV